MSQKRCLWRKRMLSVYTYTHTYYVVTARHMAMNTPTQMWTLTEDGNQNEGLTPALELITKVLIHLLFCRSFPFIDSTWFLLFKFSFLPTCFWTELITWGHFNGPDFTNQGEPLLSTAFPLMQLFHVSLFFSSFYSFISHSQSSSHTKNYWWRLSHHVHQMIEYRLISTAW